MRKRIAIDELAEAFRQFIRAEKPTDLCEILVEYGWQEYKQNRKDICVFQRFDSPDDYVQVTVPLDKDLKDYEQALLRAWFELCNYLLHKSKERQQL